MPEGELLKEKGKRRQRESERQTDRQTDRQGKGMIRREKDS